MLAASAATSSASSQRPVSMYAHPSTVRLPPLVPWMPGPRSRCMASCNKRTARSDSSRIHAAAAVRHTEGSSIGEPAILRRYGTNWFPLPIGSALARIHSLSTLTSTPVARPVGGGSRRSSRLRARLTAWRLAGSPDWKATVAALPRASQASAGWSRNDASSATEMSADSAAVRRPDQASAHPASRRAVSRSSGSAVAARVRIARSCTQSPWPVGTAADAAAASRRA